MEVRLLLVEDDERIRQALGLALADEGCDVVEAVSGEQALDVLGTTNVDVVLLDLMLPGMDGLDVCRTLRAKGDLPIIIVSARIDSADVIEGLEAGADDYVTKPLVASELAARIRALLRRRHNNGSRGSRCASATSRSSRRKTSFAGPARTYTSPAPSSACSSSSLLRTGASSPGRSC
jgi:two-component system, OmpR family, response regulator MtrA